MHNRRPLLLATLLLASAAAQAQDLSMQGGALRVSGTNENSFAVGVNYAQPVGDYLALSLGYLNEGHPHNHHRDGVSGQVWLRSHISEQGLSWGVGVGQYYYFDTSRPSSGGEPYVNDHGWAPIYSVQATWHHPNRWYTQVQVNRVIPTGAKDPTTSLLVGFGYRFDSVRGDKLHLDGGTSTDDTVTVLAGQSIVNSLESERSRATSIEYRRSVGRYVDWTVTGLSEGTSAGTHRTGVATQLWLIRSLNREVELGMGVGPYLALEVHDVPGTRSHKAGLVSVASRYHFTKQVVGTLSLNRVVTDYHRDADLLMVGLGYSY
ncbi:MULTISPECIES: hypothetical protein [unclassified Duganella]|uniref:hypothetical protein n=1 Tax=unclassified Duganella TaxID=2636909 RepID=UPI001E37FA53|nr:MULTISPECIES: hypothetical protein [unclassified Duganella]